MAIRSYDAVKPDTGKVTSLSFERQENYPHLKVHGGFFSKQPVEAQIEGSSHVTPMFIKETHKPDDENDIVTAEMYYNYWKRLKNAGIPTVPTMRVIAPNEVIMTNMTADGSVFFGKHRSHSEPISDQFIQHFLSINPADIQFSAQQIVKRADENNIILPDDEAFTLLVHPDGSWEVMVLDSQPPYAEVVGDVLSAVQRQEMNNGTVTKLMRFLEQERSRLTTPSAS